MNKFIEKKAKYAYGLPELNFTGFNRVISVT